MSLGSTMNTAVSALQAQSANLALISNNLANSSTVGYKTTNASFADLLSGQSTTGINSGGVTASGRQNVTNQGNISSTTVSTDVAIDGNGMFPVTYDKNKTELYFTRNGEFTPDSSGYLNNGKYYLMGWPTDSSGKIESSDTNTVNGLQAINIDRISTSADASKNVNLAANIPSDATVNATFTTSLSVYDSLGTAQAVPLTWEKTAANTWTLTVGDAVNSTTGATTGTATGITTYTVDFNSTGSLKDIKDSSGNLVTSPTVSISGWTDGAADSTIALSMGTAGKTDGVTQYSSDSTSPAIDVKTMTNDGFAYGRLKSVSIGKDGTVTAKFDNGQSVPIYKIPIATFANVDGLQAQSDNVYQESAASGSYTLHQAGTGGAGKIDGSSLESSTTDTSTELSLMIVAQQAYSAASQIITTSKSMFSDLIQAAR